ncbi:hypothetical protein C3747_54g246 [Trypanosoma cruzi]|uniref:Uncharacterized protein n=1 Tax=Trypanosoma cruzi TaxID=5693 RepID=A0A2V2WTU1_TRYCR|nr:hypothetical protein C3747_54g246 [Trypanosoma cruzi]
MEHCGCFTIPPRLFASPQTGVCSCSPRIFGSQCCFLAAACGKIEGRTFRFERSNVLIHDLGDGNDGGIHVLHRHVYFDQIMDEFYLLNPAELYVCPSCYLHWIGTRLIPHLTVTRRRIEYVDGDPNPVMIHSMFLRTCKGCKMRRQMKPIIQTRRMC